MRKIHVVYQLLEETMKMIECVFKRKKQVEVDVASAAVTCGRSSECRRKLYDIFIDLQNACDGG